MLAGILLGLIAAACQSLSYLFSRYFVEKYDKSAFHLLALSHCIMGIFSIILLPFILPDEMPTWKNYALPLVGSALSYLLAQGCLFLALEQSAASRASPLLGLKILIVALISAFFLGKSFAWPQWTAVFLSVCAAAMLNWSGGSMPLRSILWILLACFGYAISDLNIVSLVDQFQYLGLTHASTVSVCLCYIFCGLVSAGVLWFLPHFSSTMWTHAAPFAMAWFVGMLFLFACFGSIGVVFGNIVQSTRGLISILMGSYVASAGLIHLEEKLAGHVFLRRFGAGFLMVCAIALFYLGA